MARLNPYERRMLKKRQEAGGVTITLPPPPPDLKIRVVLKPAVVKVYASPPQHSNNARGIRFGATALRDFPRLASRWASDYER